MPNTTFKNGYRPPKLPGIYEILMLPPNIDLRSLSSANYIGKSVNIPSRWEQHLNGLLRIDPNSRYKPGTSFLENYPTCDESVYSQIFFRVITYGARSNQQLLDIEKKLIDELQPTWNTQGNRRYKR